MQFYNIASVLALAGGALADLHSVAACVSDRTYSQLGGTAWSVSYTFSKDYEILTAETECACNYYRNRNTGDNQWDQCPDCTFDGTTCNSADWHIGGDEMNYYCTELCHADGSEAN